MICPHRSLNINEYYTELERQNPYQQTDHKEEQPERVLRHTHGHLLIYQKQKSDNTKDNNIQKDTYIKNKGEPTSIDAEVQDLKKQANKSPTNHNHSTKHMEVDKISDNDYIKKLIIKMFSELKEDLRNE